MIVVDSSALVAVLLLESDGPELAARIWNAERAVMSVANLAETVIVLRRQLGDDTSGEISELAGAIGLEFEPVTLAQARLAGEAYRRFGKGRHQAALNYGDCFAYALAKELDLPLLYKGNDFSRTDIRSVL